MSMTLPKLIIATTVMLAPMLASVAAQESQRPPIRSIHAST